MVVWHWVQQHRWLTIIVLAFVIVSCAGGTAWALVFRTVSSPVGLREALRMYRREQTERMMASLRSRLPVPGVYTYRTRGGEGLSLMGVQRSFPGSTSMIVTDDTSCANVSWVPITQHTESIAVCPGPSGALEFTKSVAVEAIAGTTTVSTLACPSTAYLLPPGAHTGQRWSATCSLDSPAEHVALSGIALGPATISVGGQPVTTEHVRVALTYAGALSGRSPTDYWVVPGDGLVVREQESVGVTQGGVRYTETMVADLTRLRPDH